MEKVWVSPETLAGTLLKIYVKASDPDGDMRWLVVSGGRGKDGTMASVPIRLGKKFGKEVNGYVYWDTAKALKKSGTGHFSVLIEDWKGNESEEITLPAKVVAKDAKVQKAPADFQNLAIGPIMVDMQQFGYGGQ